ncbi:hypothetical protein [Patulibacter defluvii]|uniref:hypothetical protein n=1 Tax=Patulibacter defluvii TaxID=3095358 RepID=UPI002A750362|nr:hypothetical protein [Patulibacter sp. DM4]
MSPSQWGQIAALIHVLWPWTKPLSANEVALQSAAMVDVEFEPARDFVVACSRRGDERPPLPGQVAAAVLSAGRRAPLPWGEALVLLRRSTSIPGDPSWPSRQEQQLAFLEAEAPEVAAWARSYGLTRIMQSEIDCPRFGSRVEQALAESYEQHAKSADRGLLPVPVALRALPGGGA